MKKEIQKSITFLMNELKRLRKKQKENKLSADEKETLKKLASFLNENIE